MIDRNGQPIRDPQTGELLQAKSWMAANSLALRVLARLDPEWIDRKHFKNDVSIEHAPGIAGAAYVVSINDVSMLPEHEQRELLTLLSKLEDLREDRRDNVASSIPELPAPADVSIMPALPQPEGNAIQ